MALETENGKETITFSSVSRAPTLPEDKDGTDGRRRKKPSKVKKYRERKEAWLERRRTVVVERPVAEDTVAAPATNSPVTQVDSTHTPVQPSKSKTGIYCSGPVYTVFSSESLRKIFLS